MSMNIPMSGTSRKRTLRFFNEDLLCWCKQLSRDHRDGISLSVFPLCRDSYSAEMTTGTSL